MRWFSFKPDVEKLRTKKNVRGLQKALRNSNPEIRRSAAEALGDFKDYESICALKAVLMDTDGDLRKKAVGALARIQTSWAVDALKVGNDQETADAFVSILLNPGDTYPRAEAAKELGRMGYQGAVPGLILALDGRDDCTKIEAAEALGKIRTPESITALIHALQNSNRGVRVKAAIALGKMRIQESVGGLIVCLQDKSWEVRYQAAKALLSIKDEQAIEPLATFLGLPKIGPIAKSFLDCFPDHPLAVAAQSPEWQKKKYEQMTVDEITERLSRMPDPDLIKLSGAELNRRGGEPLMLSVHKKLQALFYETAEHECEIILTNQHLWADRGAVLRAKEVARSQALANARTIEQMWDGIGSWLG